MFIVRPVKPRGVTQKLLFWQKEKQLSKQN